MRAPLVLRGAVLAAFTALTGCAANSSGGRHVQEQPAPAPAGAVDPSYDWHVLVLAPFGTLLKESPVPLHEVLLFHDESHAAADLDAKDCYAIDGMPPRFVGQIPDHHLLCFDHDRLNRIEASVRLPAADAPQIFARACASWLKDTAVAAGSGTTCEGRDGGVGFSARLNSVPGESATSLTMSLAPRERAGGSASSDRAVPAVPAHDP